MGVFSEKHLAESFIQEYEDSGQYLWAKPEIEEYPLNKSQGDWRRITVRIFFDSGEVNSTYEEIESGLGEGGNSVFTDKDSGRKIFVTTVATDDEKKAIKVANERRLILKANND
jgi:hypothetical protein